ncbi:uncharacterized protein SETTUDRAFT_104947 [Exserohilum turcica Et28A]|uniref:Brix domain-containing protein n=1 Tax=Exserohilum turcicum (strain 28A) TaxID=671987 RepID=R0K854_EXST2|nr:uncharacterized protein SETTUDRAFT_104947 [Exserohilum turcica Et28A]EOA89123.1 hypothetical protein SETTUDRAFT_104947 [Exserohilum turcica Et28A]
MAAPKNTASGFKPKNKMRRQAAHLAIKKARESEKRDVRMRRKRDEDKNPELRQERLENNKPATIDSKRVWDEPVGDDEDALGWAIDVERLAKRRKLEQDEGAQGGEEEEEEEGTLAKLKKRDQAVQDADSDAGDDSDEADSMLDDSQSEADSDDSDMDSSDDAASSRPTKRAPSPSATSTTTNLDLSPEFLKQKFPAIFNPPAQDPQILITTSINSSLHKEAEILTSLFPNSTYIRRTKHAHAHKYSVREIASFASARGYTALVILMQAQHEKKPDGLDIVTLPHGPHFHFSVSNWIEGKKLPRHANDTGHYPELILNQFKTPLGILTA